MNILLIQLKRIGDLVLTTPAIAALREKFPEAKISLVVSPGCAELLPAISKIDNKLVVNNMASWLEITRTGFDYTIDFTRNDRSSFLTRLSRAKTRIASERRKQKSTFRSRAYNTFVAAKLKQLHTVDYNLKLLEPLGIGDQAPPIQLKIPEAARKKAKELRTKRKIEKQFIVFHPGSARAEKFWEADRWADVIAHAPNDCAIVLTGGASSLEQNHLREIKSKLRRKIVDLSDQTDLLTLAALISQARLLVTVDSAPMHFAAAARIPQIALFGPTNPFHWRPRDTPALILQGASTTPLQDFSPDQPRVPMKQISTQAVIDAMNALLSSPRPQRFA
jgi:predicted lipopolysaccharide heptosyltransferase III